MSEEIVSRIPHLLWDSRFLKLYSEFQSPWFRILHAKFSWITVSTCKNFPDFGIRSPLYGAIATLGKETAWTGDQHIAIHWSVLSSLNPSAKARVSWYRNTQPVTHQLSKSYIFFFWKNISTSKERCFFKKSQKISCNCLLAVRSLLYTKSPLITPTKLSILEKSA